MAADGFTTDVDVLKDEGKHFVRIGRSFEDAAKGLQSALSELEGGGGAPPEDKSFVEQFTTGLTTLDGKSNRPPWGDDEIGEKFGVVYEGLRDGMYESMGHLAAQMQEIGKALESMGKNHASGEDFNEAIVRQSVDNAMIEPTGSMARKRANPA
ncbi:hypothetical protein MTQ01_09510 [Streptomyces sp. XM4193]|uniref:hypothetical protein n=1 Tax=Streptomyces sp. XM4193 TaxID=2929782 RepID=UPI001FF7B781|nr:hypothetical protein [Streptomyces sp. XM4193]MCK1796235.1 hypothetical protein [Streptomyces sp. XM4193]